MNNKNNLLKIIVIVLILLIALLVIFNRKSSIEEVEQINKISNEIANNIYNNVVDFDNEVIEIEADEEIEDTTNKIVNEIEISNYQTTNKDCKATYYLKVNYGQNVVTVYTKDEKGDYIIPYKVMLCSCGTATPKNGIYKTSKGYAWGTVVGGLYAQYSTRIKGNILFHSIPYQKESKDTMEYWEYDKLGTTASAGCVRLRVEDCKWIFDNCEEGTIVEFYTSKIPSPYAKPTLKPISDNIECRNWDPTDDVPENPWKKYN